eukprot:TRINITY_DN15716_c0_g1_i1.p1 TRINITY_DN15716_c0_g1~~TRINITY_DN15716_c0_g1_i1.p1  ORF type:complete len:171 (-),score=10.58 TRINITY_DN15716_c0_g1_i1:249-761(-)
MSAEIAPKISEALCAAFPMQIDANSVDYNFRMIDYYQSKQAKATNQARCGEHRDFGLFTLISQDKTGGLQIQRDNKWHDIKSGVILLFGWCAQIANGKIKATKHRVVNSENAQRRNSGVLFVAPDPEQVLSPFVEEKEVSCYQKCASFHFKRKNEKCVESQRRHFVKHGI